ncbi:MAG: two-component system, cell cycle response regulator DivK [Bryobacterales bacterium]|jgi:CheY-like chemotaxis protein|nr:two-component system, cell cycle response regulator DivK [Bryobacterales bacterium]
MPKRILIADDQLPARELLRTILSSSGYEVLEAADGDEAVRLASESPPDLILLDIQMPGRDGFAVCTELRADPRFALVPIIAMTAGLMRGERERALAAGFSEFLGKPISLRTLRTTVAGLLNQAVLL